MSVKFLTSRSHPKQKTWIYQTSRNIFQLLSFIAVLFGVVVGYLLRNYVQLSKSTLLFNKFPGDLLIHMLKMITIPLVTTSVIIGASRLSHKIHTIIPLQICVYIVITNLLSAFIGLALVLWTQPGAANPKPFFETLQPTLPASIILKNLLSNLIPRGFVISCFTQFKTQIRYIVIKDAEVRHLQEIDENGTNIFGLIAWSIVVGILLNNAGHHGELFLQSIAALNHGTKSCVAGILRYLPVGLFFTVVDFTMDLKDWSTVKRLGLFTFSLLMGLLLLSFVVLPLIYLMCVRRNPYLIIKGIYPALFTAFFIASSSATLPETVYCCEKNLNLDKRITRFMLPLAKSVSKNGTTLCEVVSVFFVTQLNAIELDMSQIVSVVLLSLVSALGTAGIPSAGAMKTLFILSATDLPVANTYFLVSIQWFLDRLCSVVNVYGDCIGVSLIADRAKHKLRIASPTSESESEYFSGECTEDEEQEDYPCPKHRSHWYGTTSIWLEN